MPPTFNDLTSLRNFSIDGKDEWLWVTSDNGALDGPLQDWQTSHVTKYFTHVRKYRSCIQAGGNCGLYAYLMSLRFNRVFTFEPDALNFHCLVANNPSDNVIKFQMALGRQPGTGTVHQQTMGNVGMHRVTEDDTGLVPIMPIDAFNFQDIDLIQLDVEGFESHILLGAEKTIERCRPVITCENGSTEIDYYLQGFGYEKIDQSVSDSIYAIL